jgi:hypothetical protein
MFSRDLLRRVAFVGAAAVLLQQAVTDLPLKARQEAGFLVLVLALLAVVLTLRLLLPAATRKLLRHKDLLVPLGLLVLAEGVLGWLLLLPVAAVLVAFRPLHLGVLTLSLSGAAVLGVLLRAAYGTWATTLILDAVRRDRADPLEALGGLRRWFWRVLGLECIGWGALFAGLALALALAAAAQPLAILLIGAGSLLWNLATAALLPVALDDRLSFGAALRAGIGASWAHRGRWWKPVMVQLLLLGAFTFVSVSYTETSGPGGVTTHTTTNWGVNGFWTGGYTDDCRWYGALMQALEAPKLGMVNTALGLLFGVLAVTVKLHIVTALEGPTPPVAGSAPEGGAGPWRPVEGDFPVAGEGRTTPPPPE